MRWVTRVLLVLAVALVICGILAWVFRGTIALEYAKHQARKELEISIGPHDLPAYETSQVEVKLPARIAGGRMLVLHIEGYRVEVPEPISYSDARQGRLLEYPAFKVWVRCFPDCPEMDELARSLGCSGRFALERDARDAKVSEISNTRSFAQLKRHVALIGARNLFMRTGGDRLYGWFDRGDLKGLIDGDMSDSRHLMYVEMYEATREAQFSLMLRGNTPAGRADAEKFLATIRVAAEPAVK